MGNEALRGLAGVSSGVISFSDLLPNFLLISIYFSKLNTFPAPSFITLPVANKDGKAIIDTRTGQQMITRGLKYKWIEQTKSTANGLLTVSDWYVTRKSETDTAIPSDISKYREDVRTATKTIEDKINACTKLADFMKLFDAPVDKDGNPTDKAPIYNFPDEVI